jgi:hypothetical protein
LFVDFGGQFHFFEACGIVGLILKEFGLDLVDFLVLKLDIFGFLSILSLKQKVMVIDSLNQLSNMPFDLIHFDGVFVLFFVERLKQLRDDLTNFGFDFIPFELLDGQLVLFLLCFH